MENNIKTKKEEDLIQLLKFRYLPYWPLFGLLVLLFGAGAWFYIRNVPPAYEIFASVMIKDANKGLYESNMSQAFNVYNLSKIVENEMEVIRSKPLLRKVADKLNLYTPVYEKGDIWSTSAYYTSPINVQLKNPDDPNYFKEENDKIFFTYNAAVNTVSLGNRTYPLDKWVTTNYGTLLFSKNEKQYNESTKPLFFYIIHPKAIVFEMSENLGAEQVSRYSSVLSMTYYDEVPERGEIILNEIIKEYDAANLDDKMKVAANTVAFVDERIQKARTEVDSIESRIKSYKAQQGIVNLSEQGALFLQNVSENDRKISNINIQNAVLDQVESYVLSKNNSAGIVPSTLGVDDPVLSRLLQKLYDSEIEYERLRKTTAENNPIIVALSNEIEKVRPGILENIRSQRKGLQASKENLSQTNSVASSVLRTIPEKERALLEISRQQLVKNDIYTFLLQKREETALNLSSISPDSRVVNSAEASIKPISPKKKIVALAALIGALLLGFLIINYKEYMNSRILFRSEIEDATSVPIVAEISRVKSKHPLVVHQPKMLLAQEQFRRLRTSLGLNNKAPLRKKILITSSISGEGKSFISDNLALSLAQSGKKVVIVDLDLRNPRTSKTFQAFGETGIREYLEDDLEPYQIIKKTSYPNLYLVPAGAIPDNPSELLFNGKLEYLFNFLGNEFQFVIADISPVDPLSDAYVLSEYFDATLYVVRHGVTPKRIIDILDENNKIKAFKDLMIVFNGIKPRGFAGKGYGFGQGYGYENVYRYKTYATKT